MTPKEAADTIRQYLNYGSDFLSAPYTEDEYHKALELAIQALEEKHQQEIVPIGTKARVTDRIHGHNFKIGDIVTIDDVYFNTPYECTNLTGGYDYLSREEFEIIEQ